MAELSEAEKNNITIKVLKEEIVILQKTIKELLHSRRVALNKLNAVARALEG